jgi:membrane-associated phospholipid phosphatase
MHKYAILKKAGLGVGYLASLPAVFAIILLCYFFVDRKVAEFFWAIPADAAVKQLFAALSYMGEAQYYLVPPLILYVLLRKRFAYAAQASLFVFSTVALSGIAVNILKFVFGRVRPELYFKENLFGFDWFHYGHSFASFPSCHSATAFGAWLAFSLIAPGYRWFFITVGVLIASSRVVLTAHYVSDVIGGIYVGAVATLILYNIMLRSQKDKLNHAN